MAERSALLDKDHLAWMIGATVTAIDFYGTNCWTIDFSNGGYVQGDPGTWRLSRASGIIASSEDHGHQFGLPAPVDSAAQAIAAIGKARVTEAFVRAGAPDLVVQFENQLVLDVLASSFAYECWKIANPSGWTVVVHGSGEAGGWQEPLDDGRTHH